MKIFSSLIDLVRAFLTGLRVSLASNGDYRVWGKREGTEVIMCLVDVTPNSTLEQMRQWGEGIRQRIKTEKQVVVNFYEGSHDMAGFIASYQDGIIHDLRD